MGTSGINDNHGTTAVFTILQNLDVAQQKSPKKQKGKGKEKDGDDKESDSDKGRGVEDKEGSGDSKSKSPESKKITGSWHATICNLGDSRCIVGHYSKPDAIPLTIDHKPTDEEEVKRIQAAGGSVVRRRVDGILAVSRALGDATYKTDSNLPPEKQKVYLVFALPK
jgi:serine/threonine protein phosphatase PrpC